MNEPAAVLVLLKEGRIKVRKWLDILPGEYFVISRRYRGDPETAGLVRDGVGNKILASTVACRNQHNV